MSSDSELSPKQQPVIDTSIEPIVVPKAKPVRLNEHLNDYKWPKGVSGNSKGRPVGSVSPITAIKQVFDKDPTLFKAFIREYMQDRNNLKHIVEMIDGKPRQSGEIELKLPKPLDDV